MVWNDLESSSSSQVQQRVPTADGMNDAVYGCVWCWGVFPNSSATVDVQDMSRVVGLIQIFLAVMLLLNSTMANR